MFRLTRNIVKRSLAAQASSQPAVAATPSGFDTQSAETEYSYDQVQEPSADNKSAFRLTGYPIPASFNDDLKQFKMITATKSSQGIFQQFTISMKDVNSVSTSTSEKYKKHHTYEQLKQRLHDETLILEENPKFKPAHYSVQGTTYTMEDCDSSNWLINAEFVKLGGIPLLKVKPIESMNMVRDEILRLDRKKGIMTKRFQIRLDKPNLDHYAFVRFKGSVVSTPKEMKPPIKVGSKVYNYSFVMRVDRGFPLVIPVLIQTSQLDENPELHLTTGAGSKGYAKYNGVTTVHGRLNEQQSETDRDGKLFVLVATRVTCDKINLPAEIVNPSKPSSYELDEDELAEYDENNKQALRSANQSINLSSKKNFGKLMQKQARAAIEEKERDQSTALPEREFKPKQNLNLTADAVLEEEVQKELKLKKAKEELEKKLEGDVSVGLVSEEEGEKRRLHAEKLDAEKVELEKIEKEKLEKEKLEKEEVLGEKSGDSEGKSEDLSEETKDKLTSFEDELKLMK